MSSVQSGINLDYEDSNVKLLSHRDIENLVDKLTQKSLPIRVKTLYDRNTRASRILRDSWNQFELVKFDEKNVRRKGVLNRLQKITENVDSDLGNATEKLSFDEEHNVVCIMWIPAKGVIAGYLSAEQFNEYDKLHSYVNGVITTRGKPISEPVFGITRLWCPPVNEGTSKFERSILNCLVEAYRKTNIDGPEIQKSELGFISLTDEIINFLRKYLDYPVTEVRICFPPH